MARRAPTTPGRRDAISDSEGEEEEEGDAPPASLPPSAVPLVIPYAPIAQVPDLRVRFLPAGAGTAKKDKGKYKRRRSEAEVNSPEAEDGGKQKKKKKEKQR